MGFLSIKAGGYERGGAFFLVLEPNMTNGEERKSRNGLNSERLK